MNDSLTASLTATMTSPSKWWKVYSGDQECRVFKALTINLKPGVDGWRSIAGMVKETGLKQKEVEIVISKYLKNGMIIQHSEKPDMFMYWENGTKKPKKSSISDSDKKKRLDMAMGKDNPANTAQKQNP